MKEAEQVLEAEIEQYEYLKDVEATFSKAAEESQSQADTIQRILEFVKNNTCKNEDLNSDGWISFGTGFH